MGRGGAACSAMCLEEGEGEEGSSSSSDCRWLQLEGNSNHQRSLLPHLTSTLTNSSSCCSHHRLAAVQPVAILLVLLALPVLLA